ncbi:MAG: methyltransferase domain-containing protein [Candidatus Hydrogenedentes bacterium]|nr:methyltransferase domain-containing protein [Candidatus Hydrogenedentota bacterium]
MSGSSQKSSRERETLAMDPGVIDRIGLTRYRLLKLWIRDVNGAFDEAFGRYVDERCTLLDAGCSRGDPDLPAIGRAGYSLGCDVDMAGLRANKLAQGRVCAPLDALPLRCGSIDVIVCKFVIEHVAAPLHVFREFWRVLRPGGIVAILTPNSHSVFALLSRLIPHGVKRWAKKWLFGGHEEDTFETLYRANTPRRLSRLMAEAGFRATRLDMLAGMWAFFIFNEPLARVVRAAERLQMRVPGLRRTCTHMMGVWQKPLGTEAR